MVFMLNITKHLFKIFDDIKNLWLILSKKLSAVRKKQRFIHFLIIASKLMRMASLLLQVTSGKEGSNVISVQGMIL